MLTEIRLSDWKSFGSGDAARNTVKLGRLTLLVGPNGSGKSNLLDALRFLQGTALAFPVGDVLRGRLEGGRAVWPEIRGHVAEAARKGRESFALDTEWSWPGQTLSYSLTIHTGGQVYVEAESLWKNRAKPGLETLVFDTHGKELDAGGRGTGGAIQAVLRRPAKGVKRRVLSFASFRTLLPQIELETPEVSVRAHESLREDCQAVRRALCEARFLDMQPGSMRDYRPASAQDLGTTGGNLSPVLLRLNAKPERLADITGWLSELCAPQIAAIEFDRTQLDEVMMYFVEGNGQKISARSLSDGTLRFLGLLTALITCEEGSLVVVEEPDIGLHPSRIRLLAELLQDLSLRRNLQIVATTHSAALLSHLRKESLGQVVAFGREDQTGTTVCARVQDLPHFEQLWASKEVDHLISTGWLEMAL